MALDQIKTIFVVMLENRSFDHMLGYLSLAAHGGRDVDGQRDDPTWKAKVANRFNAGEAFEPFPLTDPFSKMDADPPHSRTAVAKQLGTRVAGAYQLKGFVDNYAGAKHATPPSAAHPPPVMGWFGPDETPVTAFLADHFCVCDRWFAALPAGTQPNRLMAMSGMTRIDTNKTPMPNQPLVYDWLTARGVRWRVYHQTIPFFALMPRWIDDILAGDRFRPFERLGVDLAAEGPDEFPQVVFLEPAYTSAPHLGESTDDHAPTAIKGGQKFLFEVYRDITAVRSRWERSVTIITYDEHGGFFDHVSPPAQETRPPPDADWDAPTPFTSLGVRVPALVVSPFVDPGQPHHGTFDHTSILKLLGAKFGGGSYSPEVDARGVDNLADVLRDAGDPNPPPPAPSIGPYLNHPTPPAGFTPGNAPQDEMEEAFQDGLDRIRDHPNNPDHLPFNPLLVAFPPKA